ncbi:hypothetical protein M501DRAFT_762512 [Patellaria atrata CBS 101060]|uniref:Uncharacterized protein n=1 Tax=Patellaria atrata CBS 101060 TaxID=1346257 RepID=A0A9P4SC39_9PEZI|nr:hypothetical protein M501DRAFT_762512 [Patellaria atrata CBS 101060]
MTIIVSNICIWYLSKNPSMAPLPLTTFPLENRSPTTRKWYATKVVIAVACVCGCLLGLLVLVIYIRYRSHRPHRAYGTTRPKSHVSLNTSDQLGKAERSSRVTNPYARTYGIPIRPPSETSENRIQSLDLGGPSNVCPCHGNRPVRRDSVIGAANRNIHNGKEHSDDCTSISSSSTKSQHSEKNTCLTQLTNRMFDRLVKWRDIQQGQHKSQLAHFPNSSENYTTDPQGKPHCLKRSQSSSADTLNYWLRFQTNLTDPQEPQSTKEPTSNVPKPRKSFYAERPVEQVISNPQNALLRPFTAKQPALSEAPKTIDTEISHFIGQPPPNESKPPGSKKLQRKRKFRTSPSRNITPQTAERARLAQEQKRKRMQEEIMQAVAIHFVRSRSTSVVIPSSRHTSLGTKVIKPSGATCIFQPAPATGRNTSVTHLSRKLEPAIESTTPATPLGNPHRMPSRDMAIQTDITLPPSPSLPVQHSLSHTQPPPSSEPAFPFTFRPSSPSPSPVLHTTPESATPLATRKSPRPRTPRGRPRTGSRSANGTWGRGGMGCGITGGGSIGVGVGVGTGVLENLRGREWSEV